GCPTETAPAGNWRWTAQCDPPAFRSESDAVVRCAIPCWNLLWNNGTLRHSKHHQLGHTTCHTVRTPLFPSASAPIHRGAGKYGVFSARRAKTSLLAETEVCTASRDGMLRRLNAGDRTSSVKEVPLQ